MNYSFVAVTFADDMPHFSLALRPLNYKASYVIRSDGYVAKNRHGPAGCHIFQAKSRLMHEAYFWLVTEHPESFC
jgi:hypothetical protein